MFIKKRLKTITAKILERSETYEYKTVEVTALMNARG